MFFYPQHSRSPRRHNARGGNLPSPVSYEWLCQPACACSQSVERNLECLFLKLASVYLNSRDEVRVVSHLLLQSLQEGEICGFSRPQTLFVLRTMECQHCVCVTFSQSTCTLSGPHYITHQYGYDPSVFLLNQVTDDLVVEKLDWLPLNRVDVRKASTSFKCNP